MPGMKMTKKLSPKQMKIASAAAPKDKITGADFAELKKQPTKKKNIMSKERFKMALSEKVRTNKIQSLIVKQISRLASLASRK